MPIRIPTPPTFVEQWSVENGATVHRRQDHYGQSNFAPSKNLITQYIEHLGALRLGDPCGAVAHYERALALREQALKVRTKPAQASIAERLGTGSITASEAARQLARTSASEDAQTQAQHERETYLRAATVGYRTALRAIFDFGEDGWLAVLRPLIDAAIASMDNGSFFRVHLFADFLRDPDVAGLARLALPGFARRERVALDRYMYARPDLYHAWRVAHADRLHTAASVTFGSTVFQWNIVRSGPRPKLTDADATWGPGLYTAAEALAFANEILFEQEKSRATVTPPNASRVRANV